MNDIANRSGAFRFPNDEELLEWLQTNYHYSQYQLVEVEDEVVS